MALFCALSCPVLSCPRTLPAACRTGRLAALPEQFVTRISPDARALCQASRTSEVLQAPGQPCRRPVPGPFCAPFSGTGREVRRIQGAHPRHDSLVTASLPHVLRAQTSSFQLPCIASLFRPFRKSCPQGRSPRCQAQRFAIFSLLTHNAPASPPVRRGIASP